MLAATHAARTPDCGKVSREAAYSCEMKLLMLKGKKANYSHMTPVIVILLVHLFRGCSFSNLSYFNLNMPTHQFPFSGTSIIHLLNSHMAGTHTHTHTETPSGPEHTYSVSITLLFLFNKQQRNDTKLKQNQR